MGLKFDVEEKTEDGEILHLIYRGGYEYFSNKHLYSEEIFQIFQNEKNSSLVYKIEVLTRFQTGEFLKTQIYKKISSDWTPQEVKIDKYLGQQYVQEKFVLKSSGNTLNYFFKESEKTSKVEIPVPPKFQIATPDLVSSMIFISSKKFDPTGKNYYNVLSSQNYWEYLAAPKMKYVFLERVSTTPEKVVINNKKIKGMKYLIYADDASDKGVNHEFATAIISKYLSIPYLLEEPKGLKIQIKYLNNLGRVKDD